MKTPSPVCIGCQKRPVEIEEYVELAEIYSITPDECVRREEGTYNDANGHFVCTDCYIAMGMPSSPKGWVAP